MSKMEFESLVPNIELDDKKKPFIEALRWAIGNEKNKNIAITGTYGAGKSSIIDTFIEHENIKNKTVKVSIATFDVNKSEANSPETPTVPLENMLEQQILQQLLYKIEPDKIPFSQFTRVHEIGKSKVFTYISFIILMIVVTYLIISNDAINKGIKVFLSGDLTKATMITITTVTLIVLYTCFVYLCMRIFQKLGLSKFGVGTTTIEVVTKDNNTVFSRYLDEIIYFFQQSKFQYVIFEDLDRFENIGIYERLKGLNTILNGTKQLEEQNIVFIYALKDDLFTNNDGKHEVYNRTKFFDFIIPTIKVAHSSNAENVLLRKLHNEFINEHNTIGLTKDFIENIALFIDDMRILINICNEYLIYKTALNSSSITPNRLFAFIVYKNIYPGDYSQLLNKDGILYKFLNEKTLIIEDFQIEIKEIEDKINLGMVASHFNSDEVELLFFIKNKEELNRYDSICICQY